MSRNSNILKKLLINRSHKNGAEIGVFEGDTTKGLVEDLPNLERLVCVDLWQEDKDFKAHTPNKKGRIYNANWHVVKRKFVENVVEPCNGKVLGIQMKSTRAAEMFSPETFDFIFIDANHGYEFVKEDILAWWPKLKKGGLMCGDDYQDKPTHGVIRAVDELLPRRNVIGPIWYANKVTTELL